MHSVYSLADVRAVIQHPDVGQCVISDEGGGRVVITHNGDLSSHTTTATGYVVVNKLRAKHGACGFELPQNSSADMFMRKLINYLETAPTNRFALTRIDIYDQAAELEFKLVGCTPQKRPDDNYDQQSGTRNYNWLVAEVN